MLQRKRQLQLRMVHNQNDIQQELKVKGGSNMNKCQGCQQSVDTMKDKKFYQVRIDGVLKKRCWICKSCAEETARLGEYFQLI